MNHIVLTNEQAQVVRESKGPLEVRDPAGRTLAHLAPLDPGDVLAIEQSKRVRGTGGAPVPSDQVRIHLQRLEEVRKHRGDLNESQMLDMLRRSRVGEPV